MVGLENPLLRWFLQARAWQADKGSWKVPLGLSIWSYSMKVSQELTGHLRVPRENVMRDRKEKMPFLMAGARNGHSSTSSHRISKVAADPTYFQGGKHRPHPLVGGALKNLWLILTLPQSTLLYCYQFLFIACILWPGIVTHLTFLITLIYLS